MIKEIATLDNLLSKALKLNISEIFPDIECEEYYGFNFKINHISIKFRKSKLTPKKIGQFVTLWKRDYQEKTVPFDIDDHFDYYIISVEEKDKCGYFLFPREVLQTKQILSSKSKEGKRGFRVYTNWHFPENKQAEKTKQWQTEFFINFSEEDNKILEKLKKILNFKKPNSAL